MSIVYRRTAKGDEEIINRRYKLDHSHRFVLIMINGEADVDSILSRSSQLWNAEQGLQELEEQGFIENIESNSQPTPSIYPVQQQLINTIKKHLPKNNSNTINKIIKAGNDYNLLSDAINSSCVFIKLTISENISQVLKSELHEILANSNDL